MSQPVSLRHYGSGAKDIRTILAEKWPVTDQEPHMSTEERRYRTSAGLDGSAWVAAIHEVGLSRACAAIESWGSAERWEIE